MRRGGIFDARPETKLLFHTMVKNTFRLSFLLGLPWFVGNYAKFELINFIFFPIIILVWVRFITYYYQSAICNSRTEFLFWILHLFLQCC